MKKSYLIGSAALFLSLSFVFTASAASTAPASQPTGLKAVFTLDPNTGEPKPIVTNVVLKYEYEDPLIQPQKNTKPAFLSIGLLNKKGNVVQQVFPAQVGCCEGAAADEKDKALKAQKFQTSAAKPADVLKCKCPIVVRALFPEKFAAENIELKWEGQQIYVGKVIPLIWSSLKLPTDMDLMIDPDGSINVPQAVSTVKAALELATEDRKAAEPLRANSLRSFLRKLEAEAK
jgi:hypothetical protein